jgi:hypothetical protein
MCRLWGLIAVLLTAGTLLASEPIDVGSRRELMIDDALTDQISGQASLQLQHPEKRNIALIHDSPWEGTTAGYHTVFRDTNPDCRKGEEYKGLTSGPGGLFALKSSDGIHWSRLRDQPIITKGTFDTHNISFWDPLRKHYWAYIRDFHNGIRDIRAATSTDYLTWTEPVLLKFNAVPDEPLYTNSIVPYWRAPHIFVGFPTRYSERPNSPVLAQLPDWAHRQNRMKIRRRKFPCTSSRTTGRSRPGCGGWPCGSTVSWRCTRRWLAASS